MRLPACLMALMLLATGAKPTAADEPSLALILGDATRRFTASELLARSEAADVTIPRDVAYEHAAVYRAVPLLTLLSGLLQGPADTLEIHALDGFVAQIPLSLVWRGAAGGAAAWVAIEPPDRPWPILPGKDAGAGPFYLVWEHPERSGVTAVQWPYQITSITAVESPAHRWPQLVVDPSLPPEAPASRGQEVFIANCLPCHRLNGGGAGEAGPDLGTPMNATEYLTIRGLRALVRNPKAVRTWPLQQMPGFTVEALPEADLDALVAYLGQIAARESSTPGQR